MAVFDTCTKNISVCDTDIDAADPTADTEFYEVLSTAVPMATCQSCVQAAVSARPSVFDMGE